MALFKRGKWWWTDFSENGTRHRQSLETTDWREAQAREKEKIVQASAGKLAPGNQQFARTRFSLAADRYLEDQKPHLAPRSIVTAQERLKPLKEFFKSTSLNRVTAESVFKYIARRRETGVSNRTINMEVGWLARLLKRAKRWHMIADEIKPLPERRNVGRALSREEKRTLIAVAVRKPAWQLARLAAVLALNTTMRACEIRGLQWRDVNFIERTFTIRRSKTEAGERVIPLNEDAWAAVLELRERSKLLLGSQPNPNWYLFPHGEGQGPIAKPKGRPGPAVSVKPDPTKPMSTWRTAWRSLTREAGLPGLRFHDLRHHAITELAESSASDQIIMAIAGHVAPKMLAHYSHVRLEAKRQALNALTTVGVKEAVTAQGTSQNQSETPQVLSLVVDVTGLEPATPCLQSRCSPN
jgi:integrase